jgi:proteic killer suppression protein
MIKTFRCKETQRIFEMQNSHKLPPDIHQRAYRKLVMLNNAASTEDLRLPPANHLEKLSGDREEQYSIRINGQWRICFVWKDNDAHDVEIVDYH